MPITVDIQSLNPEAAKAAPAVARQHSDAALYLSGVFLALAGRFAR
jgi:hypothetical protein